MLKPTETFVLECDCCGAAVARYDTSDEAERDSKIKVGEPFLCSGCRPKTAAARPPRSKNDNFWAAADSAAAAAEGWNIFTTFHDDDPCEIYEIERQDDPGEDENGKVLPDKFTGDDDAIRHVVERAAQGSTLHLKALFLHNTPTGIAADLGKLWKAARGGEAAPRWRCRACGQEDDNDEFVSFSIPFRYECPFCQSLNVGPVEPPAPPAPKESNDQ